MKKKIWWTITAVVVVVVAVAVLLIVGRGGRSPYETLCDDGYSGSAEELVASLVGEQHAPGVEVSAYAMAQSRGYEKSFDRFMQTLVGATTEDTAIPAYTLACENGYAGTLAQWVDTLVPNPQQLGRSMAGESKTDYELACEYGFEGSFGEWMVSLANETIQN